MKQPELYGGWPTTADKATGTAPVRIKPGSPEETIVMLPITTNPDDALPFPKVREGEGDLASEAAAPVQSAPAAKV